MRGSEFLQRVQRFRFAPISGPYLKRIDWPKGARPGSPWQNPYAERLIGTIRRECLDHMIVFGEAHLRRAVGKYMAYYNKSRIHRALNKDAPFPYSSGACGKSGDYIHSEQPNVSTYRENLDMTEGPTKMPVKTEERAAESTLL